MGSQIILTLKKMWVATVDLVPHAFLLPWSLPQMTSLRRVCFQNLEIVFQAFIYMGSYSHLPADAIQSKCLCYYGPE